MDKMKVDGVFDKDKVALVLDHLFQTRILNQQSTVNACGNLRADMTLPTILM